MEYDKSYSSLLSQNLGQTIDQVTRDLLASTSSFTAYDNSINDNTPTEITIADIDAVNKGG